MPVLENETVSDPVAAQVVEIWSRGGGAWLGPNPVELRGGPLRTSADGRFQTPDNLLVGSTYRVVVRAAVCIMYASGCRWKASVSSSSAIVTERLGQKRLRLCNS